MVTRELGRHTCALCADAAERDHVIMPFLRDGLGRGERCLVRLNPRDVDALTRAPTNGIDLAASTASRQLQVLDDQYATASTDELLASWERTVAEAVTVDDYPAVRMIIGLTQERRRPGSDGLIRYESAINDLVLRHPVTVLCLYDAGTVDGGMIIDLVRTHSQALVTGSSYANPYCLTSSTRLADPEDG
ncbi:MEDS domain-containing protein [Pseudonocardia sp. H11422]|uniref:MEDS domain-containing protein n=1 Tax=Pseudonocardia sp. H11422 TaxID=2835866 RepID=UPI001BDC3A4F|nr:MEDS domain-containing protein [Pseudonocardia sp. H11422]